MNQRHSFFLKFLKSFAMIFIVGNMFFVDYSLYIQSQKQEAITNPVQENIYADKQTVIQTQQQLQGLQTKVQDITAALSTTPMPVANTYAVQPANAVKDVYIPFGSGSSQTIGWTDVPGLQSYIDTSLYPHIKTVTFEVAGHTPTGNQIVQVQLFNVNNNHLVWNSTISWSGGGSQYIISPPITLDNGNTLYKVQMNTQVGAQAFIDQAKVHIVLY